MNTPSGEILKVHSAGFLFHPLAEKQYTGHLDDFILVNIVNNASKKAEHIVEQWIHDKKLSCIILLFLYFIASPKTERCEKA